MGFFTDFFFQLLDALLAGTAEPVALATTGSSEWPVAYCNAAFAALTGESGIVGQPFADVLEQLIGRELALDVSEAIREGRGPQVEDRVKGAAAASAAGLSLDHAVTSEGVGTLP